MVRILLGAAVMVLLSGSVVAQVPNSEKHLTIVRLQAPTYPAMASAARVWGEVNLSITLAMDGTAASVTVDSGPAMLRQAAIESAKGSKFQPIGESQVGKVYELLYRFSLEVLGCDQARDRSYPLVKFESNTVAISEQIPPLCDPGADLRVRSAKCLFLWKCRLKRP